MKTIGIAALVAAAALAGCTFKSTTVERPAPVVYAQPAPTVVYQAPPTVVYEQPPAYSAPQRSIVVNYTGTNGFQLAAQRADAYCDEHYGDSDVRLVNDNRSTGRATFACVQ
jgi:hypothetical protein